MLKEHRIKDHVVKSISVPLIAFLFPNVTGLIINNRYHTSLLLIQYWYFIFVVYTIWQGNATIIMYIKRKMDFDKGSYQNYILIILLLTIIYAGLTASCLLSLWTVFFKENLTATRVLLNSTLLLICVSIFITIIYENYLLNRKKLSALSKAERLNLAKTQAELTILKSQIDPHFLFNSLNTLSHLICTNPENAKLHNDTLAKVYQYIPKNKEKNLIVVKEEIEFISNYFYLLSIRFGSAIQMVIEINNIEAEELLIPPISLQTLVENAMKHNSFSEANPLKISIAVSLKQIIISNKINYKNSFQPSSKTGLANLDNRYKLITNKRILIVANEYFTVKLPIINAKQETIVL